jgi:hypothetical protein
MTYLIFAKQGQVENDLKRFGVGGQDDEVCHTAVQSFCGLVGALLQLYHLTVSLQSSIVSSEV